eukprot:364222-Chlamydomonas_euryale.AAC.6
MTQPLREHSVLHPPASPDTSPTLLVLCRFGHVQVHERLTRILAEEDLSVLDKHPNGCGSCCITS